MGCSRVTLTRVAPPPPARGAAARGPRPPSRRRPRRYVSPLYLRVEDVPEYALLGATDRAHVGRLAVPLRERDTTSELIDRDAVWTAKRAALELIYPVRPTPASDAEFYRYRRTQSPALQDCAT